MCKGLGTGRGLRRWPGAQGSLAKTETGPQKPGKEPVGLEGVHAWRSLPVSEDQPCLREPLQVFLALGLREAQPVGGSPPLLGVMLRGAGQG